MACCDADCVCGALSGTDATQTVKLHNSCCRAGGVAVLQRLLPDMMVEFLRKDKLARVLPGPSVYDHR